MFLDKKKTVVLLTIAVFFISLDRLLKVIALKEISLFSFFGGIFSFKFAPNPNIAFSLPLGGVFLNLLIPVLLVLLLYYFKSSWRKKDVLETVASFSIFLGAISNYFDRLAYGYVIDYFDLKYFTVFNLADSMIVLGVGAIILKSFIEERKNKKAIQEAG